MKMCISRACLKQSSVIILILLLSAGCAPPAVTPNASPTGTVGTTNTSGGRPTAIPGAPAANVQQGLARGFRAPNFTLTDVRTNKQITLSTLRGKPVFLNFWATSCPPCKKEMPTIENLYARYKGRVEFMGISSSASGDLQNVASFINYGKFSWTFLYDSSDSVSSTYQAVSYPTSYFIDSNG